MNITKPKMLLKNIKLKLYGIYYTIKIVFITLLSFISAKYKLLKFQAHNWIQQNLNKSNYNAKRISSKNPDLIDVYKVLIKELGFNKKSKTWCVDILLGDDDCKRLAICIAIELRKKGE